MDDCVEVRKVVERAVKTMRAFNRIAGDMISYHTYEQVVSAVVESLNRPRDEVEVCVMKSLSEMGIYVAF